MTATVGGRFTIGVPAAGPGNCGICGSADLERTFLDTQLTFEYYGVLYFCDVCLADMVRTAGYALPVEVEAVKEQCEILLTENIRLTSRLKATEEYVSTVLGGTIDPVAISDINDSDVSLGDQILNEALEDASRDNSETTESVIEQGPNDVRGDGKSITLDDF